MRDKQIAGLAKASQRKKQEALLKTEKAIAKLIAQKQKITIRSVARKAGVSVSYIYKYPELAYKIQRLKEQQKYTLDESDRARKNLDMQGKKMQPEQAEIGGLKNGLVKTSNNTLEELKAENTRLLIENQKLRRELEYTKQNLQQAREFILGQGSSEQNKLNIETTTVVIS
ncbi:hypothetical protein IQ255_24265 [Pleurocapsales cyanobacterium LEGE 10410]|nr:hypothetical protein [Pleurocapsales cyanobacterium LEGE 10410]